MPLKLPSLKTKLLLQLASPLLLFMLIESVLSYFVTLHYVNDAYDGWLLDSARSIAQEIKLDHGQLKAELPPAALEIFKWDDQDKTYFKIIAADGQLIAGDNLVPEPPFKTNDWSKPLYFDATLYGEKVRIVTMLMMPAQSKAICYVSVAETGNKRREMMHAILVADLVPQTILLVFMGIYLLTGVKRGLQPLHKLTNEIARRSPRDLHPIPETHIVQEVHSLITTINGLFSRLNIAIATQERFISNAAHQLRTPLAGLKLQAERALREDDIHAMQPALVHIKNSADRLSHLTSQLLILARAEPKQHQTEIEQLDLVAFTQALCVDFAPKALERDIELNFDCRDKAILINAYPLLLRELIINLLDNAIAYGQAQGQVWIQLHQHPAPQFSIIDNGPGIPVDEIDKVFERFYRIPGSRGNGCGLGLAIVKEIADLHQADLNLRRVNNLGGTQITIRFIPVSL